MRLSVVRARPGIYQVHTKYRAIGITIGLWQDPLAFQIWTSCVLCRGIKKWNALPANVKNTKIRSVSQKGCQDTSVEVKTNDYYKYRGQYYHISYTDPTELNGVIIAGSMHVRTLSYVTQCAIMYQYREQTA